MIDYRSEVTLGTIVTVLIFLFTVFGVYAGFTKRFSVLESRVADLWQEFLSRRKNDGQKRRITDRREERL